MQSSLTCPTEFVNFAHSMADKSGKIISKYYRNFDKAQYKDDNTPVTIADREAEQALRIMINHNYPNHGIVGEEYGIEKPDADYIWVLDPIDGTVSFTIGRPIFGTLISLTYHGFPVLGIIDQPILKERWVGGMGVTPKLNQDRISTNRNCTSLKDAIIATTAPNYFNLADWDLFQKVEAKAKQFVYGGDCYNYGLLATGSIDLVIESGLKVHDFCALGAIVQAAGGIMTDWEGEPLTMVTDGRVIAAANGTLHREALELLK